MISPKKTNFINFRLKRQIGLLPRTAAKRNWIFQFLRLPLSANDTAKTFWRFAAEASSSKVKTPTGL